MLEGGLVEERVSLAGHVCPHVLCGGTSADDSGSFIMVFKHGGYIFEWKARRDPRFSNVVARAVHANMPLRRQTRELDIQISQNIALPIDFRLTR